MSTWKFTRGRYERLREFTNFGACIACLEEVHDAEPDVRERVCPQCGAAKVYGLEELLLMGHITIEEPPALELSLPLALVVSDFLANWYTIERRHHDGRHWDEQVAPHALALRYSGRISDADVEGSALEMRRIASAIRERSTACFRRCAVDATGDPVEFWSPRNSSERGRVPLADAMALAQEIEEKLGNG